MRQPIVFGKYLLLERISVGGMAEVFKAKYFGEEGFEKILAIKRILPSMIEDEQFIRMFVDEAKIAGELSHPHIGQIFELGKIEHAHFIAMEFVWGKDVLQIQNRLRRLRQKMPLEMSAHICAGVCEGLDYAHRKTDATGREMHIIHRDVSPQNILVSYSGEVKIIDFGIAKARSRSSKTQAGVLKGKFGYMSPEQVRGLTLDQRSDIFSIGTLLYEMVTGERLFIGETDFATLDKVRNADVIPPSQVNPAVPPELDAIILKALRRNPDERYQWASDMQEELATYLRTREPIFSGKALGASVREMFTAERQREMARLEEYNKIDKSQMDNFTRPQPAAGGQSGEMVMSLLPLDPVKGDQDPSLDIRPEDEMEGEATTVGDPGFLLPELQGGAPASPAEVLAAASPAPGMSVPEEMHDGATQIFASRLDPEQAGGEMASESTFIFQHDGNVPDALAMADESTVIFGMDGGNGNGNGGAAAAAEEMPPQGETVLFDANKPGSGPAEQVPDMAVVGIPTGEGTLPPDHISGTMPVQIETKSPSMVKDILIGVLVALVVILAVVVWRLFAAGGLGGASPATLVITTSPPQQAEVVVDGQTKGKMVPGNPFTLKEMSAQEHVITLKRKGLPDVRRTVNLEPGDVKVLTIALGGAGMAAAPAPTPAPKPTPAPAPTPKATPAPETEGKVTFNIVPAGATVTIDGKPVDKAQLAEAIALSADKEHEVKVEMEGFVAQSLKLKLTGGQDLQREIKLEANPEAAPAPAPAPAAAAKKEPVKVAAATRKPAPAPRPRPKAAPKPAPAPKAEPKPEPRVIRPGAAKPKPKPKAVAKPKPAAKPKPVAKPKPKPRTRPKPKVAASAKGKGFLVANTKPWAKVLVDGKDTGKTTPILPRAKIGLKPGNHKVTFVVSGKKFHYTVKIVAGETARLIKKLPVE